MTRGCPLFVCGEIFMYYLFSTIQLWHHLCFLGKMLWYHFFFLASGSNDVTSNSTRVIFICTEHVHHHRLTIGEGGGADCETGCKELYRKMTKKHGTPFHITFQFELSNAFNGISFSWPPAKHRTVYTRARAHIARQYIK